MCECVCLQTCACSLFSIAKICIILLAIPPIGPTHRPVYPFSISTCNDIVISIIFSFLSSFTLPFLSNSFWLKKELSNLCTIVHCNAIYSILSLWSAIYSFLSLWQWPSWWNISYPLSSSSVYLPLSFSPLPLSLPLTLSPSSPPLSI